MAVAPMSQPSQCAAVRRPTTRSRPSGLLPAVIPHAAEPPERGVPRPVPDTPHHRMTRGKSARLASVSVTVVCAGPLELILARRAGSVAAMGRSGPVPRPKAEGPARSAFDSDRAPGAPRRPLDRSIRPKRATNDQAGGGNHDRQPDVRSSDMRHKLLGKTGLSLHQVSLVPGWLVSAIRGFLRRRSHHDFRRCPCRWP